MDRAIDALALLFALAAAALVLTVFVGGPRPGPEVLEAEVRINEAWEMYAQDGHRAGAADAAVTIVEFGDYECPLCAAQQPHLDAILRRYPDRVAVVYRHWPLPHHEHAYRLARAAECAGQQGLFWPYHTELYRMDDAAGVDLVELGREVGVSDLTEFRACVEDTTLVPTIEADIAAAKEIDATGTPTLIVNGIQISALRDSLQLDSLVQEALR